MSGEEIQAIFLELDDLRKTVGGKKTRLGKDGKVTTEARDDIEKLGDEIKHLKDSVHDLNKRLDQAIIGGQSDPVAEETAKLLTEKLKDSNDELQHTLFEIKK